MEILLMKDNICLNKGMNFYVLYHLCFVHERSPDVLQGQLRGRGRP